MLLVVACSMMCSYPLQRKIGCVHTSVCTCSYTGQTEALAEGRQGGKASVAPPPFRVFPRCWNVSLWRGKGSSSRELADLSPWPESFPEARKGSGRGEAAGKGHSAFPHRGEVLQQQGAGRAFPPCFPPAGDFSYWGTLFPADERSSNSGESVRHHSAKNSSGR